MEGWLNGHKIITMLKIKFYNSFFIINNLINALVGDLLGDGHIRLKTYKDGNFIGRLEFTFSVKNLPYLRYLKFIIYQDICTLTEPTPWPNPKTGKIVT